VFSSPFTKEKNRERFRKNENLISLKTADGADGAAATGVLTTDYADVADGVWAGV